MDAHVKAREMVDGGLVGAEKNRVKCGWSQGGHFPRRFFRRIGGARLKMGAHVKARELVDGGPVGAEKP